MIPSETFHNRRQFLRSTASLATGFAALTAYDVTAKTRHEKTEERWSVVGPRGGFSPHVGTMYSMLTMMRHMILQPVKDLTVEQLDYLHDQHANSIGAMLLHLAATETYYQINTFNDAKWGTWSGEVKAKWDVPMNLGEPGRKNIKGNNLDYYLNVLAEVREKTIDEFRKRDDDWLMKVDSEWGWNNYAKWFHVAEHESNHNGQIKWLKSRLPGAKPGND